MTVPIDYADPGGETIGLALLKDPAKLARMAVGARSVATPDAAEKLADLVERTAR